LNASINKAISHLPLQYVSDNQFTNMDIELSTKCTSYRRKSGCDSGWKSLRTERSRNR